MLSRRDSRVVPGARQGRLVRRARAGAEARLLTLCQEAWEFVLECDPIEASAVGGGSHDARLPNIAPDALDAAIARARQLLTHARAIPLDELSSRGRVTRTVLIAQLEAVIDRAELREHAWLVDPIWGPQIWLPHLGRTTQLRTVEDTARYIARLQSVGPYLDQHVANLRQGAAQGLIAPSTHITRVIRQIDELLAIPLECDALVVADLSHAAKNVVRAVVRPALARYREFLAKELLPRGRLAFGLGALPGGGAMYDAQVRRHTTQTMTAAQLMECGTRELERVLHETRALVARLLPGKDFDNVRRILGQPPYVFSTRDAVENAARAAIDRARGRLAAAFRQMPVAPLDIARIQPHAESDAPDGFYQPADRDKTRSAVYYVNTHRPETRARYTAEALAFHEAIPGHHLQIAFAYDLEDVPDIQRHAAPLGFLEGWAVYAERLADELDLYSGEIDRLGMMALDLWRTARLVVDPAIHVLGWDRDRAVAFLLANTLTTSECAARDVDRYACWPAQGLAYKVGQLTILELRAETQRRLGARFDVREFHEQVLGNGAVPLGVLKDEIDRFCRSKQESTP